MCEFGGLFFFSFRCPSFNFLLAYAHLRKSLLFKFLFSLLAALGLHCFISLVAAIGDCSLLRWLLLLQSTGSRAHQFEWLWHPSSALAGGFLTTGPPG